MVASLRQTIIDEKKAIADKKTAMQSAMGVDGTEISSGVIQKPYIPSTILGEDYLSDWTIDTINHMLRGDGQVSGVWKAIQLAIMQGTWSMRPYKKLGKAKPTPKDQEIADFAEKQVKKIWRAFLGEAVYYLPYGFSLFEVTLAEERGKIVWDRLAPRLQHTVNKWESEKGHVKRVNQYAWDEKNDMYRDDIFIPGTRILRLTNDQRGSNFEGESFMRGAYKHWLLKDAFYKIGAIQYERYGVGVPVGALPPNSTKEQEEKFKLILQGLRSNEYSHLYCGKVAGVIELKDMLTILVPEGGHAGATGMLEHINHHDMLIARSMLAQFMSLSSASGGTMAQSRDLSDLFLMNLEAITGYISYIISSGNEGENRGIKDLVDLNYSDVEGYPEWVCGRTKKTDSTAISGVIAQLIQSGAMRPDDSLEEFLREMLGVPIGLVNPRDVNVVSRGEQPGSPVGKGEAGKSKEGKVADNTKPKKDTSLMELQEGLYDTPEPLRRGRFDWETSVHFEEIRDRLDWSEENIVSTWRRVHTQQVDAIGASVGSIVNREDLEKIYAAEVPLRDALALDIARRLQFAHDSGRHDVRGELLRQTTSTHMFREEPIEEEEDTSWILPFFLLQGKKAAERLSNRTKQSVEAVAATMLVASEEVLWEDIRQRAVLLSDQYAKDEARFVNSAYGMGRNEIVAIAVAAGLVEKRFYSAMLDTNTCDVCARMDGARYSETHFVTPNPNCFGATYSKSGGNPCRCMTIISTVFGTTPEQIRGL